MADPGLVERLSLHAATVAEDEAWLEEVAQRSLDRIRVGSSGLDTLGLKALDAPIRRRVLRAWAEGEGLRWDLSLFSRLDDTLTHGGTCPLPSRRELRVHGGLFRAASVSDEGSAALLLKRNETVEFNGWRLSLLDQGAAAPSVCFPVQATESVLVRGRQPGDRVYSQGQRRKVQDLLTDAKVPREQRDRWPLVCDSDTGRPVWLVGVWPHAVKEAVQGPCVCAERIGRKGSTQAGYSL